MVTVSVHDAAEVQFPLPLIFLPVGVPYVVSPPVTRASTVPVAIIVGGQTSNL